MKDIVKSVLFGLLAILIGALAGFAIVCYGQDKADAPKPIPIEAQNKILKLQLHQQQLASEYQGCQTRMGAIPAEYQQENAQILAVSNEALEQMKLDPKKFDVNLKDMTAVAKAPAAAPETKKEPEKKP